MNFYKKNAPFDGRLGHQKDTINKIIRHHRFIIIVLIRIITVEYESIINTAGSISIVALVIKIIYYTNKYGLKEI